MEVTLQKVGHPSHTWWTCPKVRRFWVKVFTLIHTLSNVNLVKDARMALLNEPDKHIPKYTHPDPNFFIYLAAKIMIAKAWKSAVVQLTATGGGTRQLCRGWGGGPRDYTGVQSQQGVERRGGGAACRGDRFLYLPPHHPSYPVVWAPLSIGLGHPWLIIPERIYRKHRVYILLF